mgnify:FL=1|tara:strand:- start:1043 stop:1327 length:285 start_codon:yes stop_codon:yes gene_type:complete
MGISMTLTVLTMALGVCQATNLITITIGMEATTDTTITTIRGILHGTTISTRGIIRMGTVMGVDMEVMAMVTHLIISIHHLCIPQTQLTDIDLV